MASNNRWCPYKRQKHNYCINKGFSEKQKKQVHIEREIKIQMYKRRFMKESDSCDSER